MTCVIVSQKSIFMCYLVKIKLLSLKAAKRTRLITQDHVLPQKSLAVSDRVNLAFAEFV